MQLKCCDVGKIVDQGNERAEGGGEGLEGEEREGFAECRETYAELFFAEVFHTKVVEREAAEIVQA